MDDQEKRLKIAYLTSENPKDKRSWSGITYYMAQALEKHCGDVDYLEPIISFEKRYVGRLIHEISKRLLRRNVAYDRLLFVAKKHARLAAQRLAGRSFDLIVAPIAAPEVAFLETDIPIVLAEDATFAQLHNYYPLYSNLLGWSAHQGKAVQDMAYRNASALLFPSEWAVRSAVEDHYADKQKVHVIPLGANLDEIPARETVLRKKKSDRCRLLFMGIGWERKGGEIAFETLLELEAMGISAELTVCGSTPPEKFSHKRMRVIPFLNKNDPGQRRELEKLYALSDFLLVPTRREAYGIVFCEASAYGLPSITTDTGGVLGAVRDGENGFALPLSARGGDYARVIAEIYQDDQRYIELVRSSRRAFEEKLNWDAWGVTARKIFAEILEAKLPVCLRRG